MSCFTAGSRARFSYINETTYGVTPAVSAGDTQIVDFISNNINVSKAFFKDPSISENRQTTDINTGDESVAGDVTFAYRHEAQDDFLANLFRNDWAGNVLKVGQADNSMTVWVEHLDNGVDREYTGVLVDTFKFEVNKSGVIQSTFGLVGQDYDSASSGDSGPTAKVNKEPMFEFNGSIKEGGNTIGYATAVSINMANGYSPAVVLGSQNPTCFTSSTLEVTGSLTVQFKDATLLNKFLDDTYSSLEFVVADGSGNSHTWKLPRIKYTGAPINISDGGLIPITLDFEAAYDNASGTTVQVTRS